MADDITSSSSISGNAQFPKRSCHQRSVSPQKPAKSLRTVGDLRDDEEPLQSSIPQAMSQNPRLQRYLVAIEYIGTRFFGSQRQLNCRTVVGVLEDAGVHALSNVCHVDVERISKRKPGEVLPPHEPIVVRRAVNHYLQREGDMMVIDVRCVPADFHARYKAQERTYFYRLLSGPEPLSAFEKERAWHVTEELDLLAMQRACKVLVGCHDFSSFRASGCQANSPIRTLDELHVSEVVSTPYFPSIMERQKDNYMVEDSLLYDDKPENSEPVGSSITYLNGIGISKFGTNEFGIRKRHRCYVITARARSFLYHQVRLLVGVLKSVGTGDLTISDVQRILDARTVTAASPMAPACGLYLGNVKYDLP
ncbi:uncharacterized protein LOC131164798 isoform X2 [Malania oleifera]|uniref:uncharacterized protein LOC131164798 isoform X2 n=1 Tax=Malania oleifera TaxID=397392 RepID=UPI0025AE4C79|nr:uncharacterized protein LOC131164798 isoform X2 [Malania oleifera]